MMTSPGMIPATACSGGETSAHAAFYGAFQAHGLVFETNVYRSINVFLLSFFR